MNNNIFINEKSLISSDFGLKDEHFKKIFSVLSMFECIDEAILYGSRALGTYKSGSDIDITLIGKDIKISNLLSLMNYLDELMLPYKFDISIYSQIKNINLLNHINEHGISIYKK